MHVISRKALVEFGANHADAVEPLDRWYRVAKAATWSNYAEVRTDFASADQVSHLTIFNIGGNKYRLLAEIFYNSQVVLIRGVFTHREYDDLDL